LNSENLSIENIKLHPSLDKNLKNSKIKSAKLIKKLISRVDNSHKEIKTNIAVLGDKVGAGKTLMIINQQPLTRDPDQTDRIKFILSF
jgi:phosphate uptake regulator